MFPDSKLSFFKNWIYTRARRDSNPQPSPPEEDMLTIAPRAQVRKNRVLSRLGEGCFELGGDSGGNVKM